MVTSVSFAILQARSLYAVISFVEIVQVALRTQFLPHPNNWRLGYWSLYPSRSHSAQTVNNQSLVNDLRFKYNLTHSESMPTNPTGQHVPARQKISQPSLISRTSDKSSPAFREPTFIKST